MTTQASGAPAQGAQQAAGETTANPAAQVADPAAALSISEPAAKPGAQAPAAEVVVYEKTGDAALDMVLGFVGRLGIHPEDPALQAAQNGDFAPLKIKFAGMGDKAKGWEEFAALGESSFKSTAEAEKTRKAGELKKIHDAVGGDKAWDAIRTWAKTAAEPAEAEAVNKALGMGGIVAKATALYLAQLHRNATGTVIEGQQAVNPAAKGNAGASAGPLTAQQFAAEVSTLHGRLGSRMDSSPEYKALLMRRSAARRAGI
jgi:hypothetical protein